MKKRVYQKLGFLIIIIGIFIIIAQPNSPTGAVIDISTAISRITFFIGLTFIVGGTVIVVTTRQTLEKLITADEFMQKVNEIEPNKEKRSLILDTSAILSYTPHEIQDLLQQHNDVFVPDSVLDEIHNEELAQIVENNTKDIKGFQRYRKIAAKYLDRTEKPKLRRRLLPYLNGRKIISSGSEQVKVNEMTKRIRELMANAGKDLSWALISPTKAITEVKEYLERHCKVSNADVDVLAMALSEGRYKQHVIIGEKDMDLKQAINLIKKDHKKIGANIDYVEPYVSQKKAVA